jgi:DNA-binding CsgD family transcriptional regulator
VGIVEERLMTARPSEDGQVDKFLARSSSRLRDGLGIDLVVGCRLHPATGLMTVRAVSGVRPDGLVGAVGAPDDSVAAAAVARGRPAVFRRDGGGTATNAGWSAWARCREDVRSVLAVPVRARGRVSFVFYAGSRGVEPIGDATIRASVAYARELENYVARAARAHDTDGPSRWTVDARSLCRIGDELDGLTQDTHDLSSRSRIVALRDLVERTILEASPSDEATPSLTQRELEVLGLVAQGLSNAEAASRLVMSPETVKSYLRTIRGKLGVRNRTAAVNVARRSGLLQ